jgi:DNA/RNA-binding domain of Phe-tRNA-synthetase-like protein
MEKWMPVFRYSPDLLARYPNLVGGVIVARGLRNGPSSEKLQAAYTAEQEATNGRLGATPLSQIPSLAAWRSAFRAFGVDPTQYRCAAEALLRRLTKKGDIPSINTLVDLGNLVSIRYALPVAVFDTRGLQPPISVRFATGAEHFTTLGEDEAEHPAVGEVIFADETDQVYARRWCWRQSDSSAARDDTTEALITVEAHHDQARADIRAALDDLQALFSEYAGGEYTSAILDKEHIQVKE